MRKLMLEQNNQFWNQIISRLTIYDTPTLIWKITELKSFVLETSYVHIL